MSGADDVVARFAATKLRPPPARDDTVTRQAAATRLREAMARRRCTLIAAPAGYGKTTLAASTVPSGAAWFACDDDDDDPVRLLEGVVAACAKSGIGPLETARSLATTTPGVVAPAELGRRLVVALVNDVAELDREVVLVVDDVHVLEDARSSDVLRRLVVRGPTNLRMVILGRTRPGLGLTRLEMTGDVAELGIEDLALTVDEVGEVLARVSGREPPAPTVRAIHARTRGWPAAVRLLASAARERGLRDVDALARSADPDVFRLVADEVFSDLPPATRDLLLDTCVLNDLEPRRCALLSRRPDAGAILADLYERGIFVTERTATGTYRHHPLFRTFLRRHLEQTDPGRLAARHRAAADVETSPERVVDHLGAAGDWPALADRLEQVGVILVRRGLHAVALRWLEQLPARFRDARPRLDHLEGRCRYARGEPGRARELLESAATALSAPDQRGLRGDALVHVAECAFLQGDMPAGQRAVTAALDHELEAAERARLLLTRMRLAQFAGRPQQAETDLLGALEVIETTPTPEVLHTAVMALWPGVVGVAHGLAALERICQLADTVVDHGEGPVPAALSLLRWGLSLYRDARPDLVSVTDSVARWERLGGLPPFSQRVVPVGLALSLIPLGRFGEAATALDRLRAGLARMPVMPIHATSELLSARLAWHTDDLERMQGAARAVTAITGVEGTLGEVAVALVRGVAADLAGSETADGLLRDAVELEDTLHQVNFFGSARLVVAWRMLERGRRDRALELMLPALDRVADERMPGRLVVEGDAARAVLPLVRERGIHRDLVDLALAGLGAASPTVRSTATGEELTDREQEVLGLVMNGATNRDIAEELVISPETVKTHVSRILRKLDVGSRTAAAAEARRLGVRPRG